MKKNSHCSFCGAAFAEGQSWPRTCQSCSNITYINPVPVSVVLLPVDGGLLTIRRGIEPRKGTLALPGGFINYGESWQQAGARELLEETGITISPNEISVFQVLSAPDGTVLIFGLAQPQTAADLPEFAPTDETSECVIVTKVEPLGFPLHTQVLKEYFSKMEI